MLRITDLSVDYGEGVVLERLSLTLEAGLVHGLVGRNGEGKTTLLNAIYGSVRVQSGSILWSDTPLRTELISYLHTELYFYPMITGREYLEVFRSQNASFNIEGWNELFALPLGDMISTYSTGMKKKLALMAILSMERPLVILDEPFNGLDLESNLLLARIIRMIADKGKTVIVTSHILESLSGLCDKVHLLRNGQIARTYTSTDINDLRTGLIEDLDNEKMPLLKELLKGV